MPITPFIGLSVLMHIGVIIAHKVFDWTSTIRPVRAKSTPALYAVGCLIIVATFAAVLMMAGMLVRASVVDKHSSIPLITNSLIFVEQAAALGVAEASGGKPPTYTLFPSPYTFAEVSAFVMVALVMIVMLSVPMWQRRRTGGAVAVPLWQLSITGLGLAAVFIGAADIAFRFTLLLLQ